MHPDVAIVIVAQRVVEALVLSQIGDAWDSWPDIGQGDWEKVRKVAQLIATDGSGTLYEQAYTLLASRAESC